MITDELSELVFKLIFICNIMDSIQAIDCNLNRIFSSHPLSTCTPCALFYIFFEMYRNIFHFSKFLMLLIRLRHKNL